MTRWGGRRAIVPTRRKAALGAALVVGAVIGLLWWRAERRSESPPAPPPPPAAVGMAVPNGDAAGGFEFPPAPKPKPAPKSALKSAPDSGPDSGPYSMSAAPFRRAAFSDLPGWAEDDPTAARAAFLRSCARIARRDDAAKIGPITFWGTAAAWRPVCAAAAEAADDAVGDEEADGEADAAAEDAATEGADAPGAAARAFFERWFVPFAIVDGDSAEGLFTGYFEPEYDGRRAAGGAFTAAVRRAPANLVTWELGDFASDLPARRMAGLIVDRRLRPAPTRAEIVAGALDDSAPALAWLRPVDAFFLQIQGSGRVRMGDGGVLRVGYDGVNGRPYVAIGATLIAQGALTRGNVSMQSIRAWLEAHPDDAGTVMNSNPSYVFFRPLDLDPALGPLGAQGVALTPQRSLAVDRRIHAYGAPMFVALHAPDAGAGDDVADEAVADAANANAATDADADAATDADDGAKVAPFRRLMVAQDTGGAIVGAVRGDVFTGTGDAAGAIAGRMKNRGRMWALIPRALADAHAAAR